MNKQQKNEAYISRFVHGDPPAALYDIGVGPKTEWQTLAGIWPQMRLFGCEPDPQQWTDLCKVFPGPLAKVAIGWPEGPRLLHVPPGDKKCCSLLPIPYASQSVEVNVWSLDRFDREMGRPERILLWMDIEGAELEALKSGSSLLASGRVRWINLEERRPGQKLIPGWCDPADLHGLLCSHGYSRIQAYNRHPTHQDVIYTLEDGK